MLLQPWIFLLILFQAARCQDSVTFAVPKNWRSPTSNKTVDESITLVNAVVDTLSPLFNSTNGQVNGLQSEQNANVFSAISLADYRAGTTTHKDLIMTNLNKAISVLGPNIDGALNSVIIVWGLAAIDAYRAYKDPAALNIATSAWNRATQWFVTPDDVAHGSHPLKNLPIASSCYNGSTAGGVFYLISNEANTDSNGETVAAYLALTTLLSEVTSDSKYATNAELSAAFIRDNLYNGTFVEDLITLNNCARTEFALTYNSGYFLLGLSVLASKNASWAPFLHSVIASTVPFPVWTSAAGVDIEGQSAPNDALTNSFTQALKGIYIRGLYEAWNRSASDDMRNYVKSWITVQYNALQDLASLPDSNQYSPMWQGPPFSQLLPWGQLSALDVLSARVGFAHNETSATPTTSGTSGPSPTGTKGSDNANGDHASKSNVGAIVGGVIGGLLFLVTICVLTWFFLRRRRQRQQQSYEEAMLQATPSPFQTPYSDNQSTPYGIMYSGGHNPTQPSMSQSQFSASQLYMSSATSAPLPFQTNQSQANISQSNSQSNPSASRSNFSPSHGAQSSVAQTLPLSEKSGTQVTLEYEPGSSNRTRTISTANATSPAPYETTTSPTNVATGAPPAAGSTNNREEDTLDLAAVPELINQLNRIMARLPPGGVDDEAPPQYGET